MGWHSVENKDFGPGEHPYCNTCPARDVGTKNCNAANIVGQTHRIAYSCIHRQEVIAETEVAETNPYVILAQRLNRR